MPLLDDLNLPQKKAVLQTEGPLLVFAGAGSGKTRVITYRIAYLIEEKEVSPSQIFAVTFTNKAADEMRQRVGRLLRRSVKEVWISTFHSACARILRHHIDRLGFQRNFVIYDEQDQERHLKQVMKEMELDFKMFRPQAMQSAIDQLKNEGITPDQFQPSPYNIFHKRLAQVYWRYQEELKRNNGLDFGDLLLLVNLLFKKFPEILRSYQNLWRYVMVDEFQDTNFIQYQLIRQLVERHQNICVVGDDDQSIYRWRGADVGNLLNFEKDFPGTTVITLDQNYRSTQNILNAANHVVQRNRLRKEKALWTQNPEGECISFYVAEDEEEEAQFVAQKIKEYLSSNPSPQPYRDVAVFYRINAQSRALEEAFVRHRIPYTIVGGLKFYERREIKDVLAYLKWINNPLDSLSLKRIVNIPPRGIGEKSIEKIESFAKTHGLSFYEGMKASLKEDWLTPLAKEKITTFLQFIETLRQEIKVFTLSQFTMNLLNQSRYLEWLKEEGTEEALSRLENIDELLSVMMEFEREEDDVTLESFLDKVSLLTEMDLYEDKENRVSLMTLHCAKGLEFPVVFIVGMEEGLLPHYRRGEEIEDLEEERRLCYVGITRAKRKLYLSRSERRSTFGVGRANLPSRFLDELPLELIQFEEPLRRVRKDQERVGIERIEEIEETLESQAVAWQPNEFYPLRLGMKVRHPKFGEGRVRAIEGMDEEQKATIIFSSVGPKRLKVRYANLEILE
ncbi:MAG: DNA helicase PcrA [Thermodesulfobacteriota bacterium]